MATDTHELNTDRTVLVVQHTAGMEWAASPSPSVWRKRLALEGPKESGRVTSVLFRPGAFVSVPLDPVCASRRRSIVRYDPDSRFHEHGHPDGEEILVLMGSWQDANGDHPAGTFMLNPEGFRHAPESKHGCVLFVKLRQHGGDGRLHKRVASADAAWVPSPTTPGVAVKELYADPAGRHAETIRLQRHDPGARVEWAHAAITELLVLKGDATLAQDAAVHELKEGSWVRVPAGQAVTVSTVGGVELYVKEGEWLP